jgi:AMP nucleosidase
MQEIQAGIIGADLLELYTGSNISLYQPYVLLTNNESHLEKFATNFEVKITRGVGMAVSHSEKHRISIIYFGVGSPAAAFIIELLSYTNPLATLFLGTCKGLRDNYEVGDYFNPVAAIRGEGTTSMYLPDNCPSLSSFVIQRHVCQVLEQNALTYHTGVVHTTNVLLWFTKEEFKEQLLRERTQAVDNECATLFTVGFVYKVPVGAVMLISDLPFKKILTKDESKLFTTTHSDLHLEIGFKVLKNMQTIETAGFGYQF